MFHFIVMSQIMDKNQNILVIAPNLNKRWSGVTSTIFGLLPIQSKVIDIVAFGYNIPSEIQSISFFEILRLSKDRQLIWHSRKKYRNAFRNNLKDAFKTKDEINFYFGGRETIQNTQNG